MGIPKKSTVHFFPPSPTLWAVHRKKIRLSSSNIRPPNTTNANKPSDIDQHSSRAVNGAMTRVNLPRYTGETGLLNSCCFFLISLWGLPLLAVCPFANFSFRLRCSGVCACSLMVSSELCLVPRLLRRDGGRNVPLRLFKRVWYMLNVS
jgi:hypothetical protein